MEDQWKRNIVSKEGGIRLVIRTMEDHWKRNIVSKEGGIRLVIR